MLKRKMNRKKGQQGFTLLEILVVVAIMGFLVAMVAPRFAGITDGTIDVVCDSNQQRLVQVLSAYSEQKGALPSGMVNLVDEEDDGSAYYRPTHTGELEYPDEGQATFFEEFFERNLFQVHVLNEAEASELRGLGVGSVHNLNAYNYDGIDFAEYDELSAAIDGDDQESALRRVSVAAGLGVLMIGMGAEDATSNVAGPAVLAAAGILQGGSPAADYEGWGNPDWLGRIILGVGPDSALIKEGMVTAAGLCPGGINNEQVYWNNYNVVLPRLKATIARYPGTMQSYLYAKANGKSIREFNLKDDQPGYMFLTQCPEGHRFPTPDEFSEWVIYAAADDAEATRTTAETALESFFED